MSEQMNNPVNDCEKAKELLMDEIAAWNQLSERRRKIFTLLLQNEEEFRGFLMYVGAIERMMQSETFQNSFFLNIRIIFAPMPTFRLLQPSRLAAWHTPWPS